MPSPASTRNHSAQTGPKNLATLAVPFAWIRNSAIRMPAEIGTVSLATSCGAPGASRTPSTAESTDMAGVMMPSP